MSKEIITLKKEGELWVTELYGKRYGFRKWTWGEKNELSGKCSRTDPQSGFGTFEIAVFNEGLFLATVRKQTDGEFVNFTLEELKSMDGLLADKLLQITQKLNLVQPFEMQNL